MDDAVQHMNYAAVDQIEAEILKTIQNNYSLNQSYEKATSTQRFHQGITRGMVASSKKRGHILTLEEAEASWFPFIEDEMRCDECDCIGRQASHSHIWSSSEHSIFKISPQRVDATLGYAALNNLKPYCMGCNRYICLI